MIFIYVFYLEFCGMRKYIGCMWTQDFKDLSKTEK